MLILRTASSSIKAEPTPRAEGGVVLVLVMII